MHDFQAMRPHLTKPALEGGMSWQDLKILYSLVS
jgi:hypothetical protein